MLLLSVLHRLRDLSLVRALFAAIRVVLLLAFCALRDLPDQLHLERAAQLNDRVACLAFFERPLVDQGDSIAVKLTQWTKSEHLDQMRVPHAQDVGDFGGHVAYYDVASCR